jgi:hypothetical protein
LNGSQTVIKSVLNSLENGIPVLLIRESKGVADLLAHLIDKYNELSFEEKDSLTTVGKENELEETFYKPFAKEILKCSYDLNDIKQIIQVYHNSIQESNVVLMNAFELGDENDLEIAILQTLSQGNSNNFIYRNLLKKF